MSEQRVAQRRPVDLPDPEEHPVLVAAGAGSVAPDYKQRVLLTLGFFTKFTGVCSVMMLTVFGASTKDEVKNECNRLLGSKVLLLTAEGLCLACLFVLVVAAELMKLFVNLVGRLPEGFRQTFRWFTGGLLSITFIACVSFMVAAAGVMANRYPCNAQGFYGFITAAIAGVATSVATGFIFVA